MVRIEDRNSLEAWLESQAIQAAVMVAARAALRAAPFFWEQAGRKASKVDTTELSVFRPLLIAAVAAVRPTAALERAAAASTVAKEVSDAAATAADHATAHSVRASLNRSTDAAEAHEIAADAYANAAAVAAAFCAGTVAGASTARQVAAAAAHTAAAATAYAAAFGTAVANPLQSAAAWQAIEADCRMISRGEDPFGHPLWPQGATPHWIPMPHRSWHNRGPGWAFRADWYEGHLTGHPLDLDLLEKVALIPPEEWEKGDEHVNDLIEGLNSDYLLTKAIRDNPYALRVEVDQKTGKLKAMPTEVPDINQIIRAIRQSLSDYQKRCETDVSPNRIGQARLLATGPTLSALTHDLKRYRRNPLALFDTLEDARREIAAAARLEGLGADPLIERLSGALARHSEDICVASPDVLETQRNRMRVRLAIYAGSQVALAARLGRGLEAGSEGFLRSATAQALAIIETPGYTDEERKNAWYFLTAMLPRGARAVMEFSERTAESGKKLSPLDRVVALADKADKLDRGVDAIQEAVAENAGWVSELIAKLPNWPS